MYCAIWDKYGNVQVLVTRPIQPWLRVNMTEDIMFALLLDMNEERDPTGIGLQYNYLNMVWCTVQLFERSLTIFRPSG